MEDKKDYISDMIDELIDLNSDTWFADSPLPKASLIELVGGPSLSKQDWIIISDELKDNSANLEQEVLDFLYLTLEYIRVRKTYKKAGQQLSFFFSDPNIKENDPSYDIFFNIGNKKT